MSKYLKGRVLIKMKTFKQLVNQLNVSRTIVKLFVFNIILLLVLGGCASVKPQTPSHETPPVQNTANEDQGNQPDDKEVENEAIKDSDPAENPKDDDKSDVDDQTNKDEKTKDSAKNDSPASSNNTTQDTNQESVSKPNKQPENKPSSKPKEPVITYGAIEYQDTKVPFTTEEVIAYDKDIGTSGISQKGVDGINRKEVRKVFKDGVLSHTETVKDTYTHVTMVKQIKWNGAYVKAETTPKADKEMFNLINAARQEKGLNALRYNEELQAGVNIRALEITELFSHTRPNGTPWYTVSDYANGENISFGYANSAASHNGFMNSPGHYANIMGRDYKSVAISKVQNNNRAWHWVVIFSFD